MGIIKKLSLIACLSLTMQKNLLANTNACGALLCLAGGVTSGECASYVAEYFNIFDVNPAKMLTKRLNFLKLCDTNTPPPANLPTEVANAMNPSDLEFGSLKAKFRKNIEAIKLLKELEADNDRFATKEEQIILSLFSGWGCISYAFDPQSESPPLKEVGAS